MPQDHAQSSSIRHKNHDSSLLEPNPPTRYGTISRAAHLVSALGILALFALGLYFQSLPRDEIRTFWRGFHIGLGALLALPLLFRVGWSLFSKRPPKIQMPPLEQFLAQTVQRLLLFVIVLMVVTGLLTPWSGGHDLEIFGWFALPTPMAENEGLHDLLEAIHAAGAWGLIVLAAVHVAGVIKQAIRDFPSLQGRMFR